MSQPPQTVGETRPVSIPQRPLYRTAFLAVVLLLVTVAAAAVVLSQFFVRPPESAVARENVVLGDAEYEAANYGDAIEHYTSALEHHPDPVAVYIKRGRAYTGAGDYARALEDYLTAAELAGDDAPDELPILIEEAERLRDQT